MPSVKIGKKSTVTDMTPFVDVAFLILSFFIMATKFKPPEPVEITTPNSVSSQPLPENDAVMITIDKNNRVFFSIMSQKDPSVFDNIADNLNKTRNLGLTPAEIANFRKTPSIGVPYSQLKSLLDIPANEQKDDKLPGIPVMDSATNELVWWIRDAKSAFSGKKLSFLIKGDNNAKYPAFEAVVNSLKKNDELKYNLVTAPEDAPQGSELEKIRNTPVPKQ
jgi:biopolymer transport protein ExbD